MASLLQGFVEAKTPRDVENLIQAVQHQHGFRLAWKPVGDNENNFVVIHLGNDPAAGLVERIVNAIDAVLEREWVARGRPCGFPSPRDACEQWFGIPGGKLENVRDVRSMDMRQLADKIKITLWDSGNVARPTIDIRDQGIGISADNFGKTILSLHEGLKRRQRFLIGAFGQGGSTALSYSEYTIIISRPSPSTASNSSRVAVTLVRFNPSDYEIDKHGLYEYMVDHSTGYPLEFDEPEASFSQGTLVRHVMAHLGRYHHIMTAPTGSLWYLAHHYLFDPVLPFRIEEQRDNKSRGKWRTVGGNHRLLTHICSYHRHARRAFRSGNVEISWWVIPDELKKTGHAGSDEETEDAKKPQDPRERITGYVSPSKPVVVTYNGRKQGELPNTIIKNDLRLPYLDRYLVVHVNCDQLDNESRRQLFSTTRESLRDTSFLDDLRLLVVETLAADDDLVRLDRERKQRLLRPVNSQPVENIRRRLANRVKGYIYAAAGGSSPRTRPPESRKDRPQPPLIPVQEPPTLLQIISPNPRKVYAGQQFRLRFKTDAEPLNFETANAFMVLISPPSFGKYTGAVNVHNGYGTAYIRASGDNEIGSMAEITLELRPPRAKSLTSSVRVEVIALPVQAGTGPGQIATPNIELIPVLKGDNCWVDFGWDETSVARVVQGAESVEIYVSLDNRRLNRVITRAQRTGVQAVEAVKDFYLEHIGFHAFQAELADQRSRPAEDHEAQEGSTLDSSDMERGRQQEFERACETVCGIIESLFDLLTGQTLAQAAAALDNS